MTYCENSSATNVLSSPMHGVCPRASIYARHDCVVFADPKQSRIDIVQAAGRALRRYPGKDYGYILVPLIVPPKMNFEDFAETTAFRQVVRTITALSTQDERIAEEFRAIEKGYISSGKIVEIEGDVPVGMKIKLHDFADAISTRLWRNVARANWRRFDDARSFARSLGLKSVSEWSRYSSSGERPADIPGIPSRIYAATGWVSWGDWLGTGTVATSLRQYRPFKEARAFVRRFGLKSGAQWRDYSISDKKPADIPAEPSAVYAERGWMGIGDWLGTGRHHGGWQPFKKARAFIRQRQVTSISKWFEYCKSGKKPLDIPSNPQKSYANSGWAGWSDWLGTGTVAPQDRQYRFFLKARTFVRRLGLKSVTDWSDYCRSGKKPEDIPANPQIVYADAGWEGWGGWLGSNIRRAGRSRSFRTARAFARRLGLHFHSEWKRYCRSGKKPFDIPMAPQNVYADAGWEGLGDWLGSGAIASQDRQYRSFARARAFVRRLGLKSGAQWRDYCRSGKKPEDIPASPDRTYAKAGWMGIGDWLRTGRHHGGWQPFKKARAVVRGLGLKSQAEWIEYCHSGKMPSDIPISPNVVYAKAGWMGFGDWLGTGTIATLDREYRSFTKARALVRNLGLKSQAEWKSYIKSGTKPADIPKGPDTVYAGSGWVSWGDWLGSGVIASDLRKYRSFARARAFVRRLGLKSGAQWRKWYKCSGRPADIPTNPNRTYVDAGWAGWNDWLGNGRRHPGADWRSVQKGSRLRPSLHLAP